MSMDEASQILDYAEDNYCLRDNPELLGKVTLLLNSENSLFRERAAVAMSDPNCDECYDKLFERLIIETDRDVRSRILESLSFLADFIPNRHIDEIINEYENPENSRSSKISIIEIALRNHKLDFASSKTNDDYIIGDLVEMHIKNIESESPTLIC